jgi:pimeloyl-ACP methyl ester carboxylesterase
MNDDARMLLFAFLAYYDFYQPSVERLQENLAAMLKPLALPLGFSGISWGPAAHKGDGLLSDALMYAVKHPRLDGGAEHTLAIRGTNPLSIPSWLFQDLNVAGLVPWSRQSTRDVPSGAYISKATDTSIAIHRGLSSGGVSVLDWLVGLLRAPGDAPVRLNVCGHSLGGLQATTFALWLRDQAAALGLDSRLELKIYAYAGPSAGNDGYAAYLDAQLGGRYASYDNYLDIATHVWQEDEVYGILPGIYEGIPMNDWEKSAYRGLRDNIRGLRYKKLGNRVDVPSGLIGGLPADYLVQAAAQHVVPYLDYAFAREPALCGVVLADVVVAIVLDLLKDLIELLEKIFGFSAADAASFRAVLEQRIRQAAAGK